MEVPETVEFNGVVYRLMGGGRYYLSQSTSNEGRRHAKGLHVAIWEFYSGQKVPDGYEVHHKDGDPLHNEYSNLECVPRAHHRKISNYKTDRVKKHLDEIRPLASAWHGSEEGVAWHRQHGRECMEQRDKVDCVCLFCGKTFQSKDRNAKFCSHNCGVKYDYRTKGHVERRKCVMCGKEFDTLIGGGHRGSSTCGKSCQSKLLWARKRGTATGL